MDLRPHARLHRHQRQLSQLTPLKTDRLTLRPARAADAAELHRLINDWAVVRMMSPLVFPYPRALMDKWVASTERERQAGTAHHLVITGEEGGREMLIGAVGLDVKGAAGQLGYWVAPRFQGHGVATEAAGRFARWALAHLDIERLEADVAIDNPASSAVLRRIGFRETGRGEKEFLARGGKHPVVRYGATRADLDQTSLTLASQASIGQASIGQASIGQALAGERPVVLVAACALVDADGRVLIARRPEGKPMAGLWEFPGGKLAPGETPEQALIRELREELGVDVQTACLAPFAFASHGYERFHLLMPLYLCRRWSGRPQGREGQALAWVWPSKLGDYPMPEADKPLAPLLRDFL